MMPGRPEAREEIDGTQNASCKLVAQMSAHRLKYRCFMAACIMMGAGCLSLVGEQQETSKDPASPGEYRIGAGDVLQIGVWREPDASLPSAVVRVDGRITVPLIGELKVAGLTLTELKDLLVEKFSHYINNPVVTVDAREIHSRKIYLVGNVRKEGPIPLAGPMTVLQAIDEAGGLGDWANKKKIYVLRNVNGKQVKLPFDYNAVIKGQHLEQNIALLPDDTIVVP
jgi:polysaccharide export outer membrane protein